MAEHFAPIRVLTAVLSWQQLQQFPLHSLLLPQVLYGYRFAARHAGDIAGLKMCKKFYVCG